MTVLLERISIPSGNQGKQACEDMANEFQKKLKAIFLSLDEIPMDREAAVKGVQIRPIPQAVSPKMKPKRSIGFNT